MSSVRTSAGRTLDFRRSIATLRSTTSAASSAPLASSRVSSSKSLATSAVSSGEPVTVISLPRTWMSAPKAPSITCSSSSRDPSRLTIEWSSGITILTRVRPSGDSSPLRGSVGVSVKSPSPPGRAPGIAWCSSFYPQPPSGASVPTEPGQPRRPARRPERMAQGGLGVVPPGPALPSPGRPGQRPAAEAMRVCVLARLPRLGPGVDHAPVARLGHSRLARDELRLGHQLVEQPVAGLGQRGQIGVVRFGDNQHVHRRLRVYVPERERTRTLQHPRRGDISGRDTAEQAFCHAADLNLCWAGRAAYLYGCSAANSRRTTPLVHGPAYDRP